MSNKILTRVWEHSSHKGSALLALLSLADRADDDGYCWPSHTDTAKRARVKRPYVASTLVPDLIKSGELYCHKSPGKSSKYLVITKTDYSDIVIAMRKRFNYTDKSIAEKLIQLCDYRGEGVQTLNTLKDEKVLKVLTGVLKVLTGGVNSSEHEPSITPNKTKDSSPAGDKPAFDPFPIPETENPTQKKKTPYIEAMEHLEAVFAEARGCALPDWEKDPKAANKRWRTPLAKKWREYDRDTTYLARGVKAVTKKMVGDELTFDAPDQIIKSLSSWLIDHNQNRNGNGAVTENVVVVPKQDTRKTLAELQAEK